MRFLFLHGGPGFNSFAERAILGPVIEAAGHQVEFWNEPSRLRPDGDPFEPVRAFEHWLGSAERALLSSSAGAPVHLVAHSFTVHAAIDLARRHADRIDGLAIIGPASNPFASYTNAIRLAQRDLEHQATETASAIGACLDRTQSMMDAAMREAIPLVLQDAKLFTHYWADPVQYNASLAAKDRPDAAFDLDSFFAVLDDFVERWPSLRSEGLVTVPTLVLFGALDPITRQDEQWAALQAEIPNATLEVFGDGGHYLHLDRPHRFVDVVVHWADTCRRDRESLNSSDPRSAFKV